MIIGGIGIGFVLGCIYVWCLRRWVDNRVRRMRQDCVRTILGTLSAPECEIAKRYNDKTVTRVVDYVGKT
jgi:hypothetical protein